MADFGGPPVAQNVNPQQGLKTLSDLLAIKQQRQALDTGAFTQESAKAKATVDTQGAQENQAVVQALQDPIGGGFIDQKGNPTVDGLTRFLKIAPTSGAERYGKFVDAARSRVDFNSSLNSLNAGNQAEIGSTLSGAAAGAKSFGEIESAANLLKEQKKGTPLEGDYNRLIDASMHIIRQGGDPMADPKNVPFERQQQAALVAGRKVLGAAGVVGAGGIAAPQSGSMDNGGQIQPGAVAPALQGGGFTPSGPAITKVPAPAVTTLPDQSLAITGGKYGVPPSVAPTTPAPPGKLQPLQRPLPNAPAADQQNYKAQIAAAGEHQGAVAAAANDPMNGVQATRFRNQQILDLIPHANTGPYLKLLNTLASRLPGASGDAYQDIEHYTAQNSAALAKTMGVPGTNLGAETAAAAAGSVEKNPGALAEITKTNDALNTALSLYNKGLAKVTNNGSDPSKVSAYRQAFGQNLDINAVRWADAHRRKDDAEIKQLQDKYGKQGVAGFAEKLKILKSLSENGDLP